MLHCENDFQEGQRPSLALLLLFFVCTLFATGIANAAPPAITSPAAGSTFAGKNQSFTWSSQGNNVTRWILYIGSKAGQYDYFKSNVLGGASTGVTASGLPTNGHKAFVRLRYKLNGTWRKRDYAYYAAGQNHPPVISRKPRSRINTGSFYRFLPLAKDVDGEQKTFRIKNKPAWASFNNRTGRLSGTPKNSDAGTYNNIVISVSDERGATASLPAFSILVNRVPTIQGTPSTTATVGSRYTFTPTANDPDGNALVFRIANKPAWASFSNKTGRLTGIPAAGDIGTDSGIVISVVDGKGGVAKLPAFSIAVAEQANHAPTIGGAPAASVNAGSAYSFLPTASDADNDDLSFSIANKPAWAAFNSNTGKLSGTPTGDDLGIYSGIVISVTDGKSSAVSLGAFAITVSVPSPDTDGDGEPDFTDPDDDNDTVPDNDDYKPLDDGITVIPSFTDQVNSYAQTFVRLDHPDTNYSGESFVHIRDITNATYATAGLLYFDIPALLNGKRVDNISEATLTLKSNDEKDTVQVYASTAESFPDAASATWGNTAPLFENVLCGSAAMTPGASASMMIDQLLSAGKIVFIVDESGNDSREKLIKDNNEIYLDFTWQEIEPELVNVTQVADSRATQAGGELKYEVSLTQAPTHNVYVPLVLRDTSTATITAGRVLIFTPSNYNTPQTVVIAGKDDGSNQGSKDNSLLVYPLHSEDSAYNGNNPADHDFRVYAALPVAKSGQAYTAQADYSGTNVSFSLQGEPVGMSINEKTGVITWQPDISEVGSYDFSIIAKAGVNIVYNKLVNVLVEADAANPTDAFYVLLAGLGPASGDGSISNPFTSLGAALSAASSSDTIRTIYIRGGRYNNIAVNVAGVNGSKDKQIVLTRLPGERVKFTFSGLSAFSIAEDSSYIVFDGFEVDGQSVNDHWDMLANHWWDPLGDRTIGGGQAFNVDGQHITVSNNVIHDVYQKGVNIYKGRYINVLGNVIYNVGHSSLSGGHGIMRKWERNFHINPTDGVDLGEDVYSSDYPYRFDITGNMLLAVEQRIYSRVFNKGYANLTIDEGKPMAFDETQDTDPKSRVSHNLVLYGGIDHIRLKQNPNMEVHNNSILPDLDRTDTAPDGITDKNRLENLKFYGNLVASKGTAIDVDDSFTDADGVDEDPAAARKYDNYVAAGGVVTKGPLAGITDLGGTDASALFADVIHNDFRSVVTGVTVQPGVSNEHLDHLMGLMDEYGIEVRPSGWEHDHLRNADTIVKNVPAGVFDRSTYYIGPSSVEAGHQALFIKFVDSDGQWLYDKLGAGGNWASLSNADLTNDSLYDLDSVDIQKCDACTGAYVFQLVLPHEWFDAYGNSSNTPFSITNSDGTSSQVIYLDPANADHQIIMDYSAEGKVRSY